jgi:hypothetical protein
MAFPFSVGKTRIDYLILRLETYPQDRGTRPLRLEQVTIRKGPFPLPKCTYHTESLVMNAASFLLDDIDDERSHAV